MLNPSTADAKTNDPTIKKCLSFTRKWGYGGLQVVNLFAFRATNPKELITVKDPVGLENNRWLLEATANTPVLVAWGTNGCLLNRDEEVLKLLSAKPLLCLEKTKQGHPKHPLYVKGTTVPILFREAIHG